MTLIQNNVESIGVPDSLSNADVERLKGARIAIAGLGGVGGRHLLTLTRMGIGAFNISDLETFEIANINRQIGAMTSTIGRSKIDVLEQMAKDINPNLSIRKFSSGISKDNVYDFMSDCDVYVDGLDFFAVEPRKQVFAACAKLGIPAVTSAPLGMGAAMLTFLPGHMTFEEYFCLEGHPYAEQLFRLMAGLSPRLLQAGYLIDPSFVDFGNRRVPSTGMACNICTGLVSDQVLKILLQRGSIRPAPHGMHFDAYRQKLVHTWRPWGNRNPLQRFLIARIRKRLKDKVV